MILMGICTYLIITISKPALLRKSYSNILEAIFSSVRLNFKKDSPDAILSSLQLMGLAWIGTGTIEILLKDYLTSMPSILLSFLELLIPFIFVVVLARMLIK